MLKTKIDENFDKETLANILAAVCNGGPEKSCPVQWCPFQTHICEEITPEMWSDSFYVDPKQEIEEQE